MKNVINIPPGTRFVAKLVYPSGHEYIHMDVATPMYYLNDDGTEAKMLPVTQQHIVTLEFYPYGSFLLTDNNIVMQEREACAEIADQVQRELNDVNSQRLLGFVIDSRLDHELIARLIAKRIRERK